jgi:aryl-alcohol dehydrogenase-like predicted oxidoreductase
MNQPGITAPIIGPRTMDHLTSSLKALDVAITDADRKRIDEISKPGAAVSDFYDINVFSRLREAAKTGK